MVGSKCFLFELGMHGHGSQASALASVAAGCGDAGRTSQTARPCRVVPRGDSRIGPTRLKSAPTRPKSGRLGPYRPVSAETARFGPKFKKKKKKKRCKTHHLT